MISIALIGGTGVGKSTVADYLCRKYQAIWLDCDRIGHELLEAEPLRTELVDCFSAEILRDGKIDRKALGRIVFSDSAALQKLNAMVHPPIMEALRQRQRAAAERACPLCVLDGALLMDVHVRAMVDQVWAISAAEEIRLQRLAKGRQISREQAEQIMRNQISPERYAAYADVVLNTDQGIEKLEEPIVVLLKGLGYHRSGEA